MSVELKFISAILRSQEQFTEISPKVNENWFSSDCKKIWNFITKFYSQYGCLPKVGEVSENTGFIFINTEDPVKYYLDKLIEKNLTDEMTEVIMDAERLKLNGESILAFEKLSRFIEQKRGLVYGSGDAVSINEAKPAILDRYLKSKSGFVGIPTPFAIMTSMTGGWCPGDLSYVVARMGQGKSWLSLLAVHRAVRHGSKVLYVSGEMGAEDIGSRYFAIDQKFPYSNLRKGSLSPMDEEKFMSFMNHSEKKEFDIVEAGSGFRVADLEQFLIKGYDFLVIDAVYRLRATQQTRDRFENLANVTIETKTLALKYKIPILCTSQLNRESAKNKDKDVGLENIGMSDVIGMEAANVFGLLTVKNNFNVKKIKPMKIREGELIDTDVYINWNFKTMNFEQTVWDERDPASKDYTDHF